MDDMVHVLPEDLNRELPLSHPVGAFMAHHSLHHIVALETLFGQIVERLEPEGAFITMDLIGRNGHMRWPETLAIVRHIWDSVSESDGKSSTAHIGVLQVWAKQDGKWKLLARQAYKI